MGTVTNGKKWAGACVNGKTVSGLVKNGVVFYKKSSISYKRRIMTGDNLSGKTIFQDFPDGFFLVDFSWDTSRVLINSNDIDIYEKLDSMGFYEIYCGGYSNLMYRCDVTGAMPTTKKDVKLGSYSNAIVTEVNENEAYRHIFIEDKNIRPLKVGDKIVAGTKIYFNYPDNYYVQWPADGTYNDVIRVGGLGSFYHSRYSSGAMSISLDGFASFFHLSEYIYETDDNGNVSTNKSYIEFTEDEGEVTYIDTNNSHDAATKYILVDKTTLGV